MQGKFEEKMLEASNRTVGNAFKIFTEVPLVWPEIIITKCIKTIQNQPQKRIFFFFKLKENKEMKKKEKI